jgi:hypothetical protein
VFGLAFFVYDEHDSMSTRFNSITCTLQGGFENLEKVRNAGVKVLIHLFVILNMWIIRGLPPPFLIFEHKSLLNTVPSSLQRVCN